VSDGRKETVGQAWTRCPCARARPRAKGASGDARPAQASLAERLSLIPRGLVLRRASVFHLLDTMLSVSKRVPTHLTEPSRGRTKTVK
jgi:hypothetical protein